jgi:phosphatidylserine/phosphatidylglycerophosphate/cardiolipin synthase-like enzyme
MQSSPYEGPWNLVGQTENLENLNFLEPVSCEGYGLLRESSVCDLTQAHIRPVFRNIESELIEQINKHDFIVGCVAWLTSVPILEALQSKKVQFIVQQEDWLRPDSSEWSLAKQRSLYKSLSGIENYLADASWCCCFDIQPIRLSGKPKNKQRSNARMHHKFVLFGKKIRSEDPEACNTPYFNLVWTGSYNFTANATKSLENGLFIKSKDVVDAYFQEWRQVLLSSFRIEDRWWGESYGWSSDDEYLRDGT